MAESEVGSEARPEADRSAEAGSAQSGSAQSGSALAGDGVAVLLGLQELDSRADSLAYRREHHPARAKALEAKRRLAELAARVRPDWEAREAARTRRDALEASIAELSSHIAVVRGRLYDGSVANPRELQSLQSDLDASLARRSALEDDEIVSLEEIERLDAAVGAAEVTRDEIRRDGQDATRELAEFEAQADREAAELAEARTHAVNTIAPQLVATYEQVRSRLGGVAIARLERGQCGGCHLSIPAAEIARIRREVASAALCEQCGRILIPTR